MKLGEKKENPIAYCLLPLLIYLVGREIIHEVCVLTLLRYTAISEVSVRYLGNIVSAFGIIPVVWHFFYRPQTGKEKEGIAKNILSVLWLCAAGAGACLMLNYLFFLTGLTKLFAQDYSNTVSVLYGGDILLQSIWMILAAPLSEELIFRGVLFGRVREYSGFLVAAVVSSALFGVTHGYILQGIYSMLIGLILCMIYERNGRLWQCVVFHMAANACSVLVTFGKV